MHQHKGSIQKMEFLTGLAVCRTQNEAGGVEQLCAHVRTRGKEVQGRWGRRGGKEGGKRGLGGRGVLGSRQTEPLATLTAPNRRPDPVEEAATAPAAVLWLMVMPWLSPKGSLGCTKRLSRLLVPEGAFREPKARALDDGGLSELKVLNAV